MSYPKRLSIPQPGWLAVNLMHGGETVGMCMLATALLVSDDSDDEEISVAFESMAMAFDPLEDLRGFWADMQAAHPWMQGKIGPLVDWLEGAPDSLEDTVRRCATTLAGVSLSGASEAAQHDLMARVLQEMRTCATGTMTQGRWRYYTPEQAAVRALLGMDDVFTPERPSKGKQGGWKRASPERDPIPVEGASFQDMWAGSGMRAVGLGMLMRAVGRDPAKVRWVLQEADGMFAAICAVNMVAWDMGENIEIVHDPSYQAAAAAAYAQTHDLPPAKLLNPLW